ncbi:MAG: leucine--tRNA ligase [Polyangiaceae bacterium]|nr:leucine--tRNA ligase [Polyangiaceae bacterium]
MAYDHLEIEGRWQRYWEDHQTFRALRRAGRPKLYALDMFPYPSGHGLHVGHPEGYTATDIVARYRRMCGWDVLHPMGWDAFGLPAEQHAIQTGTHPASTTASNVATFRRQLRMLGFSYDWSREIDTTDPGYMKWTQWIFLKLFAKGLAFQAEVPVNWCPALGTVLANEEVIDGKSERGGHPVVRQPLRQWQLRITAYADRLAADLDGLDWPETKAKQREWIGRSEGAEVDFRLEGRSESLRVYTTRPDTLFGATYMVIAPDHPLTVTIATPEQRPAVEAYVAAARSKSDLERTACREKTGVFTGARAVNPVNGEPIPVFTADYVLGSYGTGAIMAVPAHDERDFEFATRFGLPIVEVVSPDGALHGPLANAFTEPGIAVQSGQFTGQTTAEMKGDITAWLAAKGLGEAKVNYKLRDWVFSRQRYWGEPIPIYFPVRTAGDPRGGDPYEIDYSRPIAVDQSELPLRLPDLEDYKPGGDPAGPLAKALEWRFFQKDGAWYARETNTMPQWAGSCWYYLRYLDPRNDTAIFDPAAYDEWMPVDLYVGGAEHAVLHLLYARFWHKVLFDIGVVKHPEPFQKLVHQGMILGDPQLIAYQKADGSWVSSDRVTTGAGDEDYVEAGTGVPVTAVRVGDDAVEKKAGGLRLKVDGETRVQSVAFKMSKARGNVVNPDDVVREYGADSLRVYEMFMGPLEQVKPWQTAGLKGVRRFLDRVHTVARRPLSDTPPDPTTQKLLHKTLKKVSEDIEHLRFNTAIAAMMELVNHLASLEAPPRQGIEWLVLMLAPFAPHLAEELWSSGDAAGGGLARPPSIADVAWPAYDPSLVVDEVVEIGVQVNGKVRGRALLARDASEAEAREGALADENVRRFLEGKSIRKLVYVPGRILNLIVG